MKIEVCVASTRCHEDVANEDSTALAVTEDAMSAVVEAVTTAEKMLNIHKATLSL